MAKGSELEPFRFSDGTLASRPAELLELSRQKPEEAAWHLSQGHFEEWLGYVGRQDLALAAQEFRREPDARDSLAHFLLAAKPLSYFGDSLDRELVFLLAGRTGVGKSSTVNSLLGEQVASVGDVEPVTAEVTAYSTTIQGVPVRVVDTPGLSDGKERDESYLQRIVEVVGDAGPDCTWFVTPLSDTRVRTDERDAISLLTQALSAEIWRRAVVVFTFADHYRDATKYADRMHRRSAVLRRHMAECIDGIEPGNARLVSALPFVGVTNESPRTPDGQHWLGNLWTETINQMSEAGFGSFWMATAHRVSMPDRRVGERRQGDRRKASMPTSVAGPKSIEDADPDPRNRGGRPNKKVPARVKKSTLRESSLAANVTSSEVVVAKSPQRVVEADAVAVALPSESLIPFSIYRSGTEQGILGKVARPAVDDRPVTVNVNLQQVVSPIILDEPEKVAAVIEAKVEKATGMRAGIDMILDAAEIAREGAKGVWRSTPKWAKTAIRRLGQVATLFVTGQA